MSNEQHKPDNGNSAIVWGLGILFAIGCLVAVSAPPTGDTSTNNGTPYGDQQVTSAQHTHHISALGN